MIPRYSRREMAAIWSPQTRFRIWFEIEAHAADAMAELGMIPKAAAEEDLGERQERRTSNRPHRRDRARDQARRHRLPHPSGRDRRPRGALRASGHDLVGRARHLPRRAARARRRHSHRRCRGAAAPRSKRAPANTSSRRPSAARTASMPSRPRSASSSPYAYAEFVARQGAARQRRARRSRPARSPAPSAPSPESIRASKPTSRREMGLAVEPISTQVIPRDRHAMYFATLGVVASSIERLATEIRHLQRTEVLEAEEFFSAGPEGLFGHAAQAQSGAVGESCRSRPHGARLCDAGAGECRALARARHLPFLRRAHDRAGRHRDARLRARRGSPASSTSSSSIPTTCEESRSARRARAFAARALGADAERRRARGRLSAGAAQRHAGLGAAKAISSTLLKADPDVRKYLSEKELAANFDLDFHFAHVETIFKRVFGQA